MTELSTPHLTLLNEIYEEILVELSHGFSMPNNVRYVAATTAADSYLEVLNKEPDTADKFEGLKATRDFLIAKQYELAQAA